MVARRSKTAPDPEPAPADRHLDGLTGLPDRWQVEAWISEQLVRNRRAGDRFGFFLVSLANLREINAGYGSAVGDEVLQAIAESLERVVGSKAKLARYLGSEFAIVWPGMFNSDEMVLLSREMLDEMPTQVNFESYVVPVRLAVAGVISDPDLDERLLTVESEAALAEVTSDPSRDIVIRDEAHAMRRKPDVLAVRLQRAFDNNEFQLYYQPIVSVAASSIVGFEAMLRWLAPDAGPLGAELVAPGAFLDVLHDSPIVVPLHAWIIRETIRQVAEWTEQMQVGSMFAVVNVDSNFVRDPMFVDVVLSAVHDSGIRPDQLLIDVNANAAGDNIHLMWPPLAELKSHGVGVALEDYGVGLGSADLLRRCRFDVIRLPRSMIGGLGLADEDEIIVRGIIRLAHDLGYMVIADGVENDTQVALLTAAGCDLLQGFLFGRPSSDESITHGLDHLQDGAESTLRLA